MTIATVENFSGIYKMTLADGSILWVPDDSQNADYVRLQAWVAAGGSITS